jgi:hypothetical protein
MRLHLGRIAAPLVLLGILVAGPAGATVFNVSGFAGTGVTAQVDFAYSASNSTAATLTIMVTNTTPSPPTNGAFTGLAFNVPTNVTGISDFSFNSTDPQAAGFNAFLDPNAVGAGSFGDFDLGITNGNSASASANASKALTNALKKATKLQTLVDKLQSALNQNTLSDSARLKLEGKLAKAEAKLLTAQLAVAANGGGANNINGGTPSQGVDPGFKATFVIDLTGNGLDTLNEASFLSLGSEPPGGNCCKNFVVRFQAVGPDGEGSDFATDPNFPPQNIPEPSSLLLLGAGLAGLARMVKRG